MRGTPFAVWAPAARAVSVVGDFNYWDGRLHPMRTLGSSGVWELFLPGVGPGAHYKYEILAPDGELRLKADPVAFADRDAAEDRVGRAATRTTSGRTRSGSARAPQDQRADRPDVDLRGPPRLVAAEPARRATARSPTSSWPTSCRAYAMDMGFTHIELLPVMAHPFTRLLGLPGDRLLRPDAALRLAGRLPRVRRPHARERARRDPRLGAGALPARRLRARPLRRHGALRARRPPPRRAPRLGHAGLQLRPPRGPQLPRLQRAVLAARVPRRRHPRRRRRLDALPRLLARAGRVGPEPVRRQRGPRRGRGS